MADDVRLVGTKLVRKNDQHARVAVNKGLRAVCSQSIIGATEKRRESGAGMVEIGDIGARESVWLGGGGSLSGMTVWAQ